MSNVRQQITEWRRTDVTRTDIAVLLGRSRDSVARVVDERRVQMLRRLVRRVYVVHGPHHRWCGSLSCLFLLRVDAIV
jgi:CRP-like cAMP-binding protein